jgi:HEAT repeat protein
LVTAALAAGQDSFQDQLANIQSPNAKTRVKAAEALGRSGRREAIQPLVEAVRDPEAGVRKAAVEALRRFKEPETLDGLLLGLEDEEKDIREEALDGVIEIHVETPERGTLGRFLGVFSADPQPEEGEMYRRPEPRVVEGLAGRLGDEEEPLRRKAARTLGILRAENAVSSLGAALADPSEKMRTDVVDALGRIESDAAGQALTNALIDRSSVVRGKAIESLGRMRYMPAATALVDIYKAEQGRELGDAALHALARMGAPQARGLFYQAMTGKNAQRRQWAVEGLGRLDDPGLLRGLTKDFLREPDPQVQLAFCFSLARLGRTEFVDRLALSLSDAKLAEQSREYLIELGSSLLSEYASYLSDPVPQVRRGMAVVLMRIGDPAAIPALEPLLSDPNKEVADQANRAIARLQTMSSM